jgi:hypothetical protein
VTLVMPGRCRHCGCGGDFCRRADGDLCVLDERALACSGEACQHAEAARRSQAEAERKTAERRVREKREAYRKAYIAMSRRGLSHDLIVEILARRQSGRKKGRAA